MKWYLVTKPWSDSGHEITRHSDGKRIPYFGISGDNWPLDDVAEAAKMHANARAVMSYVDAPNGTASLVCKERSIAEDYYDVAKKHFRFVRLLEITFGFDGACNGVEVGSPDGSYSIVDSEVIQVRDTIKLNEFGLFSDVQQANDYLALRESFDNFETLEDLDGYCNIGIHVIGHK